MKVCAEVEAYTLAELSDAARKKAVDHMRYRLEEDGWVAEMVSEALVDAFTHLATGEGIGFDSPKYLKDNYGIAIYWEVYSQGYGAWIDGTLRRSQCPALAWPEGVERVKVDYGHYYGMEFEVYDEFGEYATDEAEEAAKKMVRDLCGKLYKAAEEAYDEHTSAEYVIEHYEINDYPARRFRADGSTVPREFWTDDEDKEAAV